jgi:hypothetical protein
MAATGDRLKIYPRKRAMSSTADLDKPGNQPFNGSLSSNF